MICSRARGVTHFPMRQVAPRCTNGMRFGNRKLPIVRTYDPRSCNNIFASEMRDDVLISLRIVFREKSDAVSRETVHFYHGIIY